MKRLTQHNNQGFVILIVLVAVVIVMLLYFVQMDTLFQPDLSKGPTPIEQRPWLLEELIIPQGQGVKIPSSPKPELNESFHLVTDVTRDGQQRGKVDIFFDTDGRIKSAWDSAYRHDNRQHTMHAEMGGNVNVKQTYQDKNGNKDKSKLFFIAKGTYTQTTTDAETGTAREDGTAYLLGWLSTDKSATGHITITTNQDWVGVYDFDIEGQ